MNYTNEIAPNFQHQVIHDLCKLIDEKHEQNLKCNDLKRFLLHFIRNAVDLSHPANLFNDYRTIYNRIKEDIT